MDFTATISSKASKKLFFMESASLIQNYQEPEPILEVRPEAPRINPFEAIEERNRAMDLARLEAARISDPTQVLVKEPVAIGQTQTVSIDELPAIVRQATEAALLKRYKPLKKTATKPQNKVER